MPLAVITGASAGLGRALASALGSAGWDLILTARRDDRLRRVARGIEGSGSVVAVAGDIADHAHRAEIAAAVHRAGSLDLLVNNASSLGPTPLRPLVELSPQDVSSIFATNVVGPFATTAALLPALTAARGIVIDISSDAAVEHYPGWGAYGASKSALDHLTLTFGVENLDVACYAVDPGDMRTDMQQAAFPGEDISDRRLPEQVVPALLDLVRRRPPSGRYRAIDGTAVSAGELQLDADTEPAMR